MTKIFISGGPGSGKTTYAQELADKFNIPHFDLDDIKWKNQTKYCDCERTNAGKLALRDKILAENKNWIIEGVYTEDWIIPIIEQADKIIILKPPTWLRQYRIIRRSIRRLVHLEPRTHKESLVSVLKLLHLSGKYNKYIPELLEKIKRANKTAKILKYKNTKIKI